MSNNTIISNFFEPSKCFIIAEVAQAHDGSLGYAHSFIDLAADSGADAIKFQTHIADEESTLEEPWRVKFSYEDDTRFDYWQRMEFTFEQWQGLKKHADEKGLIFMSSPFSLKSVEWLEKLDMQAYKIASGELTNAPMLEKIFSLNKPVIFSSGMSEIQELEHVVNHAKSHNLPIAVLQCTSSYPTPPEKVGLNVMQLYKEKFDTKVGISDHSGTIFPSLAATTLGCDVIEVHITFDKKMFGPDTIASITGNELKELVKGVRFIEQMRNNPIEKDSFAKQMGNMRSLFNKSIVAYCDLPEGTIIELEHLGFKKPGHGISAQNYKDLLGKKLNKTIVKNHFFSVEDFN